MELKPCPFCGGDTMTQIITKSGKVYCATTVPYPLEVVKQMKKAGFRVKENSR